MGNQTFIAPEAQTSNQNAWRFGRLVFRVHLSNKLVMFVCWQGGWGRCSVEDAWRGGLSRFFDVLDAGPYRIRWELLVLCSRFVVSFFIRVFILVSSQYSTHAHAASCKLSQVKYDETTIKQTRKQTRTMNSYTERNALTNTHHSLQIQPSETSYTQRTVMTMSAIPTRHSKLLGAA